MLLDKMEFGTSRAKSKAEDRRALKYDDYSTCQSALSNFYSRTPTSSGRTSNSKSLMKNSQSSASKFNFSKNFNYSNISQLMMSAPSSPNNLDKELSRELPVIKTRIPEKSRRYHNALIDCFNEDAENVKRLDKWVMDKRIKDEEKTKPPINSSPTRSNSQEERSMLTVRRYSKEVDCLKSPAKQLDSIIKRKRYKVPDLKITPFEVEGHGKDAIEKISERRGTEEFSPKAHVLPSRGFHRGSTVTRSSIFTSDDKHSSARDSLRIGLMSSLKGSRSQERLSTFGLTSNGFKNFKVSRPTKVILHPTIYDLAAFKKTCETTEGVLKPLLIHESMELKEVTTNTEINMGIQAQNLRKEIEKNKKIQEEYRTNNHMANVCIEELNQEIKKLHNEHELVPAMYQTDKSTSSRRPPSKSSRSSFARYRVKSQGNKKISVDDYLKIGNVREELKQKINAHQQEIEEQKAIILKNNQRIELYNTELKSLKSELKKIAKEQNEYYHNLLSLGLETRDEGLSWIVKCIWFIGENVNIHRMPKFLDKEAMSYIFELAKKEAKVIDIQKRIENSKKLITENALKTKRLHKPSRTKNHLDLNLKNSMEIKSKVNSKLQQLKSTSVSRPAQFKAKHQFFLNIMENDNIEENVCKLDNPDPLDDPLYDKKVMDFGLLDYEKELEEVRADIRKIKEVELSRIAQEFISGGYEKRFNVSPGVVLAAEFGEDTMIRELPKITMEMERHQRTRGHYKSIASKNLLTKRSIG